jgi:hypothetical protein
MIPVQKESALYEQTARYLRYAHSEVIFHYDLSGVWTPSHQQRNLYGRLNSRAWPDLFIASRKYVYERVNGRRILKGTSFGLFIEQKREGTRLKKRDGTWASDHTAEQAAVLESLRAQGYVAEFAVGIDETIAVIEKYLGASS